MKLDAFLYVPLLSRNKFLFFNNIVKLKKCDEGLSGFLC